MIRSEIRSRFHRRRLCWLPILVGLTVAIVVPWSAAWAAVAAGAGAWIATGLLLAAVDSTAERRREMAEERRVTAAIRLLPGPNPRRHPAA